MTSQGLALIATERARQVAEEGWTAEHDDSHVNAELAWAAACYAAPERILVYRDGFFEPWPTSYVVSNVNDGPLCIPWRRPECSRVEQLIKAGALIAAEIDRLQRLPAPANAR